MANEYMVYAEDVTLVADAIREKSGNTQQLIWPDGFVSAIGDFTGSGDSIVLNVVGGTTQPSNPSKNTVWVNTSTAITGWCFSKDEPSPITNGMVWFYTVPNSPLAIDILEENSIYLYPLYAKQYVNGAWTVMETKIYQDGAWSDLSVRLYYYGYEKTELTGGFSRTWRNGIGSKTFTKNADNLYLKSSGSEMGGSNFTVGTAYKIDLTGYSTLNARIKCTTMTSSNFYISVHESTNDVEPYTPSCHTSKSTVYEGILSLDISSVSGEYYVLLGVSGSNINNRCECYVYEVYLQ
ncbi:MAG: hypothetical protein J6K74_06500 [Marinifilaceae bacterium]|nr:hypothetical protein [Marinifilaceae bacterium]